MTKEEFEVKQEDELYGIPEVFRVPIRAVAWERGHAYGYNEVLMHVVDLCDAFAPAIQAFEKEIKNG